MQKISILNSHFTAAEATKSTESRNLLEKYKNMSKLDSNFLIQYVNPGFNVELLKKYEKILIDNKHFFEQETYEEDERETKRVKVNQRLIKIL